MDKKIDKVQCRNCKICRTIGRVVDSYDKQVDFIASDD